MSPSSVQIWVSNIILQQKELGLFGDMADSRYGKGMVQDEPGTFIMLKNGLKQTNKSFFVIHNGPKLGMLDMSITNKDKHI